MAKIRTDSLYAHLQRDGLLEEFFVWFYGSRPSYDEIGEWLQSRGCVHSAGAIHRLINVHSLRWKVEQAELRSAALDESLDGADASVLRRLIRSKEFDLGLSQLSNKEALALLRFDLDKRAAETRAELERAKLDLKRQAEERSAAQLALVREKFEFDAVKAAIAHAAELKVISADGSIGEREKINRARQLLFSVLPVEREREGGAQ
jgi:hypothetical protein